MIRSEIANRVKRILEIAKRGQDNAMTIPGYYAEDDFESIIYETNELLKDLDGTFIPKD